jgi:hypothetical protein
MPEYHRDIASRLRALTYSTPGIVDLAAALEAGGRRSAAVRAAVDGLGDRERSRVVAFLLEVRHEHQDAGDAEAANFLNALIEALAQEHWDSLPPPGSDSEEPLA